MYGIFIIAFLFIPVYGILFLVFLAWKIIKKNRLPWLFVGLGIGIIGFFLYIRYLIGERRFVFVGGYVDGQENWGNGLANVGTYMQNMLILVGIFIGVQLLYTGIFLNRYRKLNLKTPESWKNTNDIF